MGNKKKRKKKKRNQSAAGWLNGSMGLPFLLAFLLSVF
jgi:hypothetical protein